MINPQNHTRQITSDNIEHIRRLLETFQPDSVDLSFTTIASAHAFLKLYDLAPSETGINQIIVGVQAYQVDYHWQSRFVYEEGPPVTLRENKKIKTLTIHLTNIDNDE
jgi:hypothetical protein